MGLLTEISLPLLLIIGVWLTFLVTETDLSRLIGGIITGIILLLLLALANAADKKHFQ